MKNIINKKLIDGKKIFQIVSITVFFALFLSNLTPVVFAQYDAGSYGSYGDIGGYDSYSDIGSYGAYGDVGGY